MPPGVEPLLVDVDALEDGAYLLEDRRLTIGRGSTQRRVALGPPTRGWIRRLAPPQWRRGVVSGSREGAVRSAWMALVVAIASDPDVRWLTSYRQLVSSESKLIQNRVATLLGIPTPRTVVAGTPDDIPLELGDRLVVKPLGIGHFSTDQGDAMVVWAQQLERSDPRLRALGGAPFLVQQSARARRHLRVVTVGQQAWSCALDADGLPFDWRLSENAHHAFVRVSVPHVEASALRLADKLQLGYSSQDWIETGDETTFLDLNPAGQWLFLPEDVSRPVAEAIGSFLAGR